jgi:3-hydroxybutyryl-CoA dehydratase
MSEQTNDFEEFYGAKFEDLAVGQSGVYARTVTEADILAFAGVTGDFNPVHVNEELAAASMFGGRIAHGMLSAGFISTVLGTKLPGPGSIYLSQTLKFKAPVKIGDTVVARCTIKELTPRSARPSSTPCAR